MTCQFCNDNSMTSDNGTEFWCMNGCQKCLTKGCENQAEPGTDGCCECELAEAIRVMNSEPFSQENQAEVARWVKRVAQKEAV